MSDHTKLPTGILAWTRKHASVAEVERLVEMAIDYESFCDSGQGEKAFRHRVMQPFLTGVWGDPLNHGDCERLWDAVRQSGATGSSSERSAARLYLCALQLSHWGTAAATDRCAVTLNEILAILHERRDVELDSEVLRFLAPATTSDYWGEVVWGAICLIAVRVVAHTDDIAFVSERIQMAGLLGRDKPSYLDGALQAAEDLKAKLSALSK